MEVVNLKVKPKESFSGELTKGYKFDLIISRNILYTLFFVPIFRKGR